MGLLVTAPYIPPRVCSPSSQARASETPQRQHQQPAHGANGRGHEQRVVPEGGRVLEAARGAGERASTEQPGVSSRACSEPGADSPSDDDSFSASLDAAAARALKAARARFGLPPEPVSGLANFGALSVPGTESESPKLAAKRLRRRIRAYLEQACSDTCRESGCRSGPRFWDSRCDRHSMARPERGTWMTDDLYLVVWAEFFRLASDESLGERGGKGRGKGQLAAFSSVRWDRFRRDGASAGVDTLRGDEPEPSAAELQGQLDRYAARFADREDDGE